VNQEKEPEQSLQPTMTPASDENAMTTDQLSPGAQAEIRQLSRGLYDVHLKQNMQRRMSNFAYEPVSLPTSRVSRMMHYLSSAMKAMYIISTSLLACLWLQQ